ncbi:ABC transporter substrate-binding protein [Sphaerobacter sp.]|uniref:ABC transporter substrate-binding protein n=1 Tax=Sphaerobacter sp. TaxID=2099654 RepID=UPI001E0194C4|nr:ABC transporter substrate-binding protein [Sphaerobacter sp.]MBX5446686.1 ABC transporter substrate-binding protein [Sphaerobacter sp.]
MSRRIPWPLALLVAVTLLLPLLAACGGSSESTATTAAETSTTSSGASQTATTAPSGSPAASPAGSGSSSTPTASGEALKIGMLAPFTGDLSDFGPAFWNAAMLAVEEINSAGGVLGQPVELVRADDGTSPQQGVEEARRLVEVERVSAIIGAAASGVTLPIAESVTGPSGIVQISPASTSPALTDANDNDFLFRTTISDAAQGVVLAQLAQEQGFKTACTMYTNNAYGQGLSEVFSREFERLGGKVLAQVPHEQEQASYASELATCTEGNPDVLAAISYPESARVYLREAVEQGLVKNFLFVDGTKSEEQFADLGWDVFQGMWGTAPGALDTDEGKSFDARYEQAYGRRPELPFLRESYDAVYVIALAAQKAGSTDPTAIRDAIREIANPPGETVTPGPDGWARALELIAAGTDINYEGAASPADFDDHGDVLKGAIEVWRVQGNAIVVQETREIDLSQ